MNCYPIINQALPLPPTPTPTPTLSDIRVCGQKWRSQRKQMCLLFIVYIIQKKKTEKIRKKINQLWHFSHRRQTRNISMRKSPKIVSIVGFLPAFSLTLPLYLSLSRGKRSSVISFQLGRQFSKNEAHTTKPKGNPTENELDLARKPQGRRRTGESTTPAMGKWLLWCFGNMCKQLRRTEQEEEGGDRKSLWHFSLAFFAKCAPSVLVIFRQLE